MTFPFLRTLQIMSYVAEYVDAVFSKTSWTSKQLKLFTNKLF